LEHDRSAKARACLSRGFAQFAALEASIHLIAEQPRNAYEITQAIWGNIAVSQAFLTLSEVMATATCWPTKDARGAWRRRNSLRSKQVEPRTGDSPVRGCYA